MSHATESTENLIRSYLLSRSFNATANALETDVSSSKDGKFQVERCVDEMTDAIEKLNVEKLSAMFKAWNTHIFNSLDHDGAKLAQTFENHAYRLLLVRCVQKKNIEKCNEFFNKTSSLTLNNPEWTDWFSFPYNPQSKNVEPFKRYFDKTWIEVFLISFHNFLSTSIPQSCPSTLGKIVEEVSRDVKSSTTPYDFDDELIDDFAVIAQCSSPVKRTHSRPSLRNILKSLTGSKKNND